MLFKKISIIGLGYIGLPTAAMFAARKIEVVGVDVNTATVDTINRGQIHIVEPDLDMVVHAAVSQGFLRATTKPEPAEAFLIAVPTPFKGDNHEPDLSYIESAVNSIAPILETGNLVILESTSPVGATEKMTEWLANARPDLSFPHTAGEKSDIRVAHCPERVLPGKVMKELISNDRIIGGMTAKCSALAVELYSAFVEGECVIASGPRVAEMAKLTENSFRDVNIAFANELSMICDKQDIDVWELIRLANRHPRVNILQPGPGVGGHCIAVDPWFIVSSSPNEARLIRTARERNQEKSDWTLQLIKTKVATEQINQLIVYGLTFKPDIDDLRESPAKAIYNKLRNLESTNVRYCDPNLEDIEEFPGEGILLSDAIVVNGLHILLVDHREFKKTQPERGEILDFRGIWKTTLK